MHGLASQDLTMACLKISPTNLAVTKSPFYNVPVECVWENLYHVTKVTNPEERIRTEELQKVARLLQEYSYFLI